MSPEVACVITGIAIASGLIIHGILIRDTMFQMSKRFML